MRVDGSRKTNSFVKKVLELRNSPYKSPSAIYSLYRKYTTSQTVRKRGRPFTMDVSEAVRAVTKKLKDRSSGSSAFELNDMRVAYQSKLKEQAAANGLDPASVKATVSDSLAKTAMLAAAMGSDVGTFTTRKVLTKTETRFQSEHSLMMGFSYAATVLATHFNEGSPPRSLSKYRPDKLSDPARETMDWMKEALSAESIYPVNPNLVLSTDDTTLFVFEGKKDGSGEWEWKIIDKVNGDASVRSDFKVGDDAENSGGLRVRLTFTFTAGGLAAPPYVAVSGLTDAELDPELCPDGILVAQVPGLCKGGDDVFNNGFGWIVFLRADSNDGTKDRNEGYLSIANKKFIQYNDDVLLPFIRKVREKLGWKKGQLVPDSLRAVSWFDGDIGQIQTMLYESREALDHAERICRNKHSAAATGTQQPCDLSPVFRLLNELLEKKTAADDVACGLADDFRELVDVDLRAKGLNLDGNRRKKRGLLDFLRCLPEALEATLTKRNVQKGFIAAGMIDEETNMVPVFDNLIGTCKRWVSISKNIGVPKTQKDHCRDQFQHLMKIQLANDQITYQDMKAVGVPLDIDSSGKEVVEDRPSGAVAEHRQPSKTINGPFQRRQRSELRRKKLAGSYRDAMVAYNTIQDILKRNKLVEEELLLGADGASLADVSVELFLQLSAPKLQDFIHARMFDTKTFQKAKIAGADGKLNKTLHKGQTAEEITRECSEEEPCLVWHAWKARERPLVLEQPEEPTLKTSLPTPEFSVVYVRPVAVKTPSEYLKNEAWCNSLKLVTKGAMAGQTTEALLSNANDLALSLEPRFDLHVSDRVDGSRQNHWTLRFVRDNIPAVVAAMCLTGHVVEDVKLHRLDESLLVLPIRNVFQKIAGDLASLEGCYLYFDELKYKWIRAGKTSGDGVAACFRGRGKKHLENAKLKDEMRKCKFYRDYPARGVDNLGAIEGYFENLAMYCGMAYDKKGNVDPLCSQGKSDSLLVWSKETIRELKKKGGSLRKNQLDAIAYLWEICYDLVLARGDNVSESPGFESFGLRVNNTRKRKRVDE